MAATDTFPVFACPVGIIRLFKHFQTPVWTPCQIDPPTGRKLLPIAPAAFRMPCFQMGLLHGFFFPAVAPAQPVMAAAFFCLFYLPADGQASIPAPRQIFSHILHLPGWHNGNYVISAYFIFSLICKVFVRFSNFWIQYLLLFTHVPSNTVLFQVLFLTPLYVEIFSQKW